MMKHKFPEFFAILCVIGAAFLSAVLVAPTALVAASPDPSEPQLHSGDLVVDAGQTYTIEDVTLIVEGNIIVNSEGTLIIRNSDVTVNSHYKNHYWVRVYSNATLLVENSVLRDGPVPGLASIGSFGRIENFRLGETAITPEGDNAQVILRNSTSELRIGADRGSVVTLDSSYLSGLAWKSLPSVKATVTGSNTFDLSFWLWGETEENVELLGLSGGENQSMHLSVEGATLDVENSSIESYSLSLWVAYGDTRCRKNVTVRDSRLSDIFAVYPVGSNIRTWDMKPGYFENWNIYDSMEASALPWNLSLINTTVDKWKLDFHGVAEVENSIFHLDTWSEARATVRNSTLVLHHTRGGYVKFTDTVISGRSDLPASARFIHQPEVTGEGPQPYVYEFENSTLGPRAELEITDDNINAVFKGELSVQISPDQVYWFGGTVAREFPVEVRAENNIPLADVRLTLLSPDNIQAWSGVTNENGRASFALKFGKDNYRENFMLGTTIDGKDVTTEVGFLTSTPITLSMITDADGDGMPDSWEIQYGLDPNTNDANQDKDGDGYTNLQEYQQGTNPTLASSYPGAGEGEATPSAEGIPILYVVGIAAIVAILIGALLFLKKRS